MTNFPRAIHDPRQQVLQEVRADLAHLERELESMRLLEKYLLGKLGGETVTHLDTTETAKPSEAAAGANGRMRPYQTATVKDAAADVLKRAAAPQTTRQITDQVLAGGYPTKNAKEFRNAVFGVLSKHSAVFRRVGAGLWELVTASQ